MTKDTTTNSTTISTNPTPHDSLASSNKKLPRLQGSSNQLHNYISQSNTTRFACIIKQNTQIRRVPQPTPQLDQPIQPRRFARFNKQKITQHTGNFYFSNDQKLHNSINQSHTTRFACIIKQKLPRSEGSRNHLRN